MQYATDFLTTLRRPNPRTMEPIFWKGYCPDECQGGIHMLQDIISTYGNVVSYKPFPDQSLSVQIDIQENRIESLHTKLRETVVLIDNPELDGTTERVRTVFLHVTFSDSTADRPHLG